MSRLCFQSCLFLLITFITISTYAKIVEICFLVKDENNQSSQ